MPERAGSASPPLPAHHEIDLAATASGADEALPSFRQRQAGAVSLDLLGNVGLGVMPTRLALLTKTIDWADYTRRVTALLHRLGKAHYVKRDLQPFLPPGYPNPTRAAQHHLERVDRPRL